MTILICSFGPSSTACVAAVYGMSGVAFGPGFCAWVQHAL